MHGMPVGRLVYELDGQRYYGPAFLVPPVIWGQRRTAYFCPKSARIWAKCWLETEDLTYPVERSWYAETVPAEGQSRYTPGRVPGTLCSDLMDILTLPDALLLREFNLLAKEHYLEQTTPSTPVQQKERTTPQSPQQHGTQEPLQIYQTVGIIPWSEQAIPASGETAQPGESAGIGDFPL